MDLRTRVARFPRLFPIAAAGLCILLPTALVLAFDPDGPSRTAMLIGRLHPLLVHLPIGFLILAALLEALSSVDRYRPVRHAVPVVLVLGAAAAVAAALAGYQLAAAGGYDGPTVSWHRRLGIAVAVGSVVSCAFWYAEVAGVVWARRGYRGSLVATLALLVAASHLGGTLTHGPGYVSEYLPPPLQAAARWAVPGSDALPAPARLDEAGAYQHLVQPVLRTRCVSCHGPDRQKGDLRLDSPDAIRKGGESGPAFVPGKPDESEIVRRIWLPEGHEDRMPPRGRSPISVAEAELIRWWIQQGAPFDRTIAQLALTPAVQAFVDQVAGPAGARLPPVLLEKVPPADTTALRVASAAGLVVRPLSDSTHFLQARCSANSACGTAQLQALLPLAEQLTVLHLGGARIGDADLPTVGRLHRLTRLHLERTAVTDAGLGPLGALRHLEYLNLVGTRVTDAGLRQLSALPRLRALYLWQSGATPAGVAHLRSKLPRVHADLGLTRAGMDSVLAAARADSARAADPSDTR